jgi:hypothetical protein
MASRTLAGIGLKGDWALGEDGWKDENDTNLVWASVLLGQSVLSKVDATPGSPAEGDTHIFSAAHGTQANKIAAYDEATWKYMTPLEGMELYDRTNDVRWRYDGTDWTASCSKIKTESGTDYDLLASDVGKYIRLTNAAAKNIDVRDNSTHGLPANGEWHFRNAGAGDATFSEGGAVTINAPAEGTLVVPEGGTVTLKWIAVDTFDLIGVTVPA